MRSISYWSDGHIDPISIVAGLVQTALYVDFFHVYFTKYVPRAWKRMTSNSLWFRVLQGQKFELPA